jgi:hypothetical protein
MVFCLYLPSERQSANSDVAQSHDNGEKGVQIAEFFATTTNVNVEMEIEAI